MARLELVASATFGLEAVVKREIEALGYTITDSRDGRLTYLGDERAIVRSNLWLRCADRVYVKMAEFKAETFEELFQQTAALPWEEWIPLDGKFTVVGSSVKSVLHSVPACQSIIKKAIVKRLQQTYEVETFEETGAAYTVRFAFLKDRVLILIDTSGEGLHKRGYRTNAVTAPIKETMAAALILLSFFKPGRTLIDPMCGSGTIPIEAALIAKNIAPGLSRHFASEGWDCIEKDIWTEERRAAYAAIDNESDFHILACDLDPRAVEAARENALEAGVEDCIEFRSMGIKRTLSEVCGTQAAAANKEHLANGEDSLPEELLPFTEDMGIIITNPPYGQRIGEQDEMDKIYKVLKYFCKDNKTWSLFLITSDKTFEKKFGRLADRRRKLFNGNVEACYYQYHGEKKPRE